MLPGQAPKPLSIQPHSALVELAVALDGEENEHRTEHVPKAMPQPQVVIGVIQALHEAHHSAAE